jgi:replicative DNA helicase
VPWEPPAAFQRDDVPPFPTETLPGWLRQFVEALAVATQTPPDLAGLLALTASAAAVAKTVEVQVTTGWREPLNLYSVVVLPPDTRKSAVFSQVVRPLERVEAERAQDMRGDIAEGLTNRKIVEERLRHAESEAAKADSGQRLALETAAHNLARDLAAATVPAVPRLLADDVSPEKLASLLAEQGGRIAVMSAEGDVFDLMAGRYSANGAPNLGVFLRAHIGDAVRVDRVNRASEHVARPALTIGLAVQPEVLRGLMDKPGFRGRGLLGRFLYALPPSPLGQRVINPPPLPEAVRQTYEMRLRALLELHPADTIDGEALPQLLHLTPAAMEHLSGFQRWIEPQLREYGVLAGMSDWAGKLAGAVARIAGVLHLVEHAGNAYPWLTAITDDTMTRAIALGHYLLAHAKAAYGEMGADPVVADARAIARWLEERGVSSLSKRDLFNGMRGRFPQVTELTAPLKLLEAHGYLRPAPVEQREGPGRKPSERYEVNPLLASHIPHFTQNTDTALAELTSRRAREATAEDDPLAGLDGWDSPDDGTEVA